MVEFSLKFNRFRVVTIFSPFCFCPISDRVLVESRFCVFFGGRNRSEIVEAPFDEKGRTEVIDDFGGNPLVAGEMN